MGEWRRESRKGSTFSGEKKARGRREKGHNKRMMKEKKGELPPHLLGWGAKPP